jgi:hypothetical protein
VGEDRAADWPGDEANGERGESRESPGHRIKGRKEDLVEDQSRGGAKDEEIIPLDRRADEAGKRHLARRAQQRLTAGPVRGLELVSVGDKGTCRDASEREHRDLSLMRLLKTILNLRELLTRHSDWRRGICHIAAFSGCDGRHPG